MLFSKEYVGYLARQVTQKLISGEFIESEDPKATIEGIHAAILDELGVEDRINEEVRAILEQIQDEMRATGAGYQETFKKFKGELVKRYKAVL